MNTRFYETPQFVAKIQKSIGCNKYNEYFLHTFNKNFNSNEHQTNDDSNGFTRNNTALSLKGVTNKFNKLHKSTQQDNERKRSANGTNKHDSC